MILPLWPRETWRRNLYVTVATVFSVFTGFAFVLPFLPLFVRELGVEDPESVALWAGVLIGVSPLTAGLLAPVWGRLADRLGHKVMAIRALTGYVVLMLLAASVRDVTELLAVRIGLGLFGGIGPLGLAMATAQAPPSETGRVVGLVQAAQILAAAIGPVAGGFLADGIGMRATFVATAVVCAATLVLLVLAYRDDPEARARHQQAAPRMGFTEVLRIPRLPAVLLVLFLVNFVGRSFTPILPLHLQLLGVERAASATGALISVYAVAAALSATGLGRATRRHPPLLLLSVSLAAGAAFLLPMAVVPRFEGFLALAGAAGLSSGGALTLGYTIGGRLVPESQRATAFGFLAGAALFGGAISPSVAGLVARWDLRGIYYVDAVLFALVAAGTAMAHRRRVLDGA